MEINFLETDSQENPGRRIHAEDSVFAGRIGDDGKGLDTTYGDLIRQAFEPVWWNSVKIVRYKKNGELRRRGLRPGLLRHRRAPVHHP